MNNPEYMIPIVAIVLVFGTPIVAILTYHQRKMTELIHGSRNQPIAPPVVSAADPHLQYEVQLLRQRLDEQAILLDDIRNQLRAADVSARINS